MFLEETTKWYHHRYSMKNKSTLQPLIEVSIDVLMVKRKKILHSHIILLFYWYQIKRHRLNRVGEVTT